jgi:hypothetical protein
MYKKGLMKKLDKTYCKRQNTSRRRRRRRRRIFLVDPELRRMLKKKEKMRPSPNSITKNTAKDFNTDHM